MDLLHASGISVDLATPAAAPPAWLAHEYPDMLPVAEEGHVFGFGNRLQLDPTSAVYRVHAAAITDALARRYCVTIPRWPCGISATSTGPSRTTRAPRRRSAYGSGKGMGTWKSINDAWYTCFWSQRYTSWDQMCRRSSPGRGRIRAAGWTSRVSPQTRCWSASPPSATSCVATAMTSRCSPTLCPSTGGRTAGAGRHRRTRSRTIPGSAPRSPST